MRDANTVEAATGPADDKNQSSVTTPARLRARAWLVGLPLLVGVSVLSVYADMYAKVVQFGVLQFSPPAVVALFGLALVNAASVRVTRRAFLNAGEMLVIYAMLLIGVMVATRGVVEKLDGSIAYLPYLVCHGSANLQPFLRYLPQWMVPYNVAAVNAHAGAVPPVVLGFYEGRRGGGVPWGAWLEPLGANFALFACVTLVFLSLGAILRRQWVDVEHLNFPLTALPVSLINNEPGPDGRTLLSNPLLWGSIVAAWLIFGLNGLHANFPTLPMIPLSFDLGPYLTNPPWNQIGFLHLYCSLAVIGFAYFMPSEVLFSLWFFYLLLQVQYVVAGSAGYPSSVSGRWQPYETSGAYVMIAASLIFQARNHLKNVWKTALGKQSPMAGDAGELLSYRGAMIGLGAGFVGILIWLCAAGANVWVALAQMGIYVFVMALVMTRAVAQAGLLMTETSFIPLDLMQMVCPAASLGAANLAVLATTNIYFPRDMRGELLAPIMDTQRTAGMTGQRPRTLLLPILLAVPVAFVAASFAFLKLHYALGGNALYDHPRFSMSREFLTVYPYLHGGQAPAGSVSPGALAVGIAVTLLLVLLRAQYANFPLHPLGFALAPTWALMVFWFGFLVAWVARSVVLRYGGLKVYRQVAPLMLGLIVGEFSSAVFWSLLNMAFHTSAPEFRWP